MRNNTDKVYVVSVIFHKMNQYQNYRVSCEVFLNKDDALKYKREKENEYDFHWCGDYNHVELLEKEIR